MRNNLVLLKALLLSTSQINILRYSTDAKKRRRIIGGFIGMGCLYVMLMAFCIAFCVGYGVTGMIDAAPTMCTFVISVLAFVFTVFKTNGYLFNFKEYDMLMSLPFEARSVAANKFLYMYIKTLPWYMSISIAMMIGYGFFKQPVFIVYPIWIVLSLFVPVIPMLIASFIGFLIAKVSSGFKKTRIIQTILTFAFVFFCFSIRFIIEALVKNDRMHETLEKTYELTAKAAKVYLPAEWFSYAVTKLAILELVLLVGVSIALFVLVFYLMGNSYRSINSALASHAAAKNYKMTEQKSHSILNAIAYKEFKRMTGSTVYMTNAAMGEIFALIIGVLTLIVGFDKIVGFIMPGAPVTSYDIIQPAIPFILYFFIGMLATTVSSPSLEGKNYWIIKSLPIEMKTVYQGKMLFNMYLSVPFMIVSTVFMCISAKVPVVNMILYLVLGFVLCAFSTARGCVCGIKHLRLDWENEVEVIKQGAGVAIYMFPNLFASVGLAALSVFLGIWIDHRLIAVILIVIAVVLAVLCYRKVLALAGEDR